MSENLPMLANSVTDKTGGVAIVTALHDLMGNLSRSGIYDDISVTLHSAVASDGSNRSVLNYRAYRRK